MSDDEHESRDRLPKLREFDGNAEDYLDALLLTPSQHAVWRSGTSSASYAAQLGGAWPSYSVSERAHRFLLADVQAQGGRRGNNGLDIHQANRLQAVASAVNHITGRSTFVPRRGGR